MPTIALVYLRPSISPPYLSFFFPYFSFLNNNIIYSFWCRMCGEAESLWYMWKSDSHRHQVFHRWRGLQPPHRMVPALLIFVFVLYFYFFIIFFYFLLTVVSISEKKICSRCQQPVLSVEVKALDKLFHPDCFRCVECNQLLEGILLIYFSYLKTKHIDIKI